MQLVYFYWKSLVPVLLLTHGLFSLEWKTDHQHSFKDIVNSEFHVSRREYQTLNLTKRGEARLHP